MPELSPLEYGTVVWRAEAIVGDSADDGDENPDSVDIAGTVTLTAVPKALLVAGATPPATALPTQVVGTMANGLMTRNGVPRVKVVATDSPETNPTGFTYTAKFDLTYNGIRIPYGPITGIEVPRGQTTDLTLVAPVPSNPGTPTIRGIRGTKWYIGHGTPDDWEAANPGIFDDALPSDQYFDIDSGGIYTFS